MSQLRCWCPQKSLLAVVGRDERTGAPIVHVKAYKQAKIIAEVIIESGTARILCRGCSRWHVVRIHHADFDFRVEDLPETYQLVG